MILKRLLLSLAILAVAGAIACYLLTRPDTRDGVAPAIVGAPISADLIARGAYLAQAADCVSCHTVPDSGRQFAGGVAFKLPFGTIYSSNITPDPETGIGTWSDDDFVRAVREGIRKDGANLYPAFPYTSYTGLSRADVLAIKAYLFSLPPIKQAERANDLSFPFDQRAAVIFWKAAFFRSKRFDADPAKPATWNSGAYLATALGHCAECHTPRNFAYGLKHGSELAGETVQGWRAYNITADAQAGIGAWTEAQLTAYLSQGHAEGRGSAAGPMSEVVGYSLQHLKRDDIGALVSYVRSVPAQRGSDDFAASPAPTAAVAQSDPAHGAAGEPGAALFAGACSNCHLANGTGRQSGFADLHGTRGVNDPKAINVSQIILHGADMHFATADSFMPRFDRGYSDNEIADLSNFVVHHFGNQSGSVSANDIRRRRQLE